MNINVCLISCAITLILLSVIVECRTKYQVCVVDGKGSFRKAARYCPVLDGPESKVECVIGLDRLDCLRRISKGKADFSIFTPEDLVTASSLRVEVLVTNEMRFTNDNYEYEVVAIINDDAGIKNRYDLRDKNFCHPGYGYDADWTQILSNYLEMSVVPQICNPSATLVENRIRASSNYFKSACKAGPWVNEASLDRQLKNKYPNLCALCDSPYSCSTDDKYWGRQGPLMCLTDGAGDISWARLDDVRVHFGLTPGGKLSEPDGFSYLCPNGTTIPLNSTSPPCVWVTKPWPVVATKRTSAQEIRDFISSLSHADVSSWKSALLNLIETYHLNIKSLEPIEAIESYLARSIGFLSANSFPACHPIRTIKICTTSNIENAKCSWLREASTVYGVEPDVDCVKADNKTHCMQGVADHLADIVMVPPDLIPIAEKKYNLRTLFYETTNDQDKYLTVAVVKKDSQIKTLNDLKGKRACFPTFDGVAWNSVANTLNKKGLLNSCPFHKGMGEFFGSSCVPNLPKNVSTSLRSLCKGDINDGDFGAMRCLTHQNADVAFLSQNNFVRFFKDVNQKGNIVVDKDNYKVICEKGVEGCYFSWAPLGHAMVRSNSTELWKKDTLDVFLQMDDLFGKNFRSLTTAFTMFGLYDGKSNVLFNDNTVRLREVPTFKNTDKMKGEYEHMWRNMEVCSPGSGRYTLPIFGVLSYLIASFMGPFCIKCIL